MTKSVVSDPDDGEPDGEPTNSDVRSAGTRSLTYELVDAIGRAIVTGVYRNKPFPNEADLARLHGVSRSVIRETVKMLAAKGLVSGRPRVGTVVEPSASWNLFDPDVMRWFMERQFSLDLLLQFSELRLGIEPIASGLTAAHVDAESADAVRRAFDRMAAAHRGADDPLEANVAFHVVVLRRSGNLFYGQLTNLLTIGLRTSIRFANRFTGRPADLRMYADIRDHIVAGNRTGAEQAMMAVITDIVHLTDQALDASG